MHINHLNADERAYLIIVKVSKIIKPSSLFPWSSVHCQMVFQLDSFKYDHGMFNALAILKIKSMIKMFQFVPKYNHPHEIPIFTHSETKTPKDSRAVIKIGDVQDLEYELICIGRRSV